MFNPHKKKIVVIALVAGILSFGSLAFRQPQEKPRKEHNLKILPKNIDHSSLMAIMHAFEDALNYKCIDCHVPTADPKKLNFISDAKPEKRVSRKMMKMVMKINRKHFKIKGDFAENFVNAKYEVTCYTCHHGNEHPLTMPEMTEKEMQQRKSPSDKPLEKKD